MILLQTRGGGSGLQEGSLQYVYGTFYLLGHGLSPIVRGKGGNDNEKML